MKHRRRRWRQNAGRAQNHSDAIHPEGEKKNALPNCPHQSFRQSQQAGQRLQRVAHQDQVAGFSRDVAADSAKRDADGRGRECRRVVDSVADHRDTSARGGLSFDPRGFVCRQQSRLDRRETWQFFRKLHRGRLAVSRQNREIPDVSRAELGQDILRGLANSVANSDHTEDLALDGDDERRLPGFVKLRELSVEELGEFDLKSLKKSAVTDGQRQPPRQSALIPPLILAGERE